MQGLQGGVELIGMELAIVAEVSDCGGLWRWARRHHFSLCAMELSYCGGVFIRPPYLSPLHRCNFREGEG